MTTNAGTTAYWMPFTANRAFHEDPRMIARAEGAYYYDPQGRKVADGLSGLWCCGAGHGRPEIAAAVEAQLRDLDYAPAFQFGHPLAFELAQRLAAMAPGKLDHVFFTTGGSDAVETALKMARAYWRLRGQPTRSKFIGRMRGYHGVNFGGLSAGGIEANSRPFGALLDVDHLPFPPLPENAFSRGQPAAGLHLADALEGMVDHHGAETIAAVIVEPMSGSAGVLPPPRGYLERLREICDRHDILLIFDEVITGFGRLGAAFAAQRFGVTPDLMTLAKGITNGAVPMGAVIASADVYDAFMGADLPPTAVELPHGYTYSAHPAACAAALATLDLYDRDGLFERAETLAPHFETALHGLRGHRQVTDIRNLGLAGALQLEPIADQPGRRAHEIGMRCWKAGAYVRAAGETIQLAPPFVADAAFIDELVGILDEALRADAAAS